jgi:hypothetical protein
MLRFQFRNIDELKKLHYEAVEDYVRRLPKEVQNQIYENVIQLHGFEGYDLERDDNDYNWLNRFILADLDVLRDWVSNQPDKLLFMDFHKLYNTFFSNGIAKFVDAAGTYNAYTLITRMGIQVCPYCDDEYIDVVESDGKTKRTSEFDHFFPEGQKKYPALAMCFFNLVLSGSNCNGLKLQQDLGTSPYDEDIEDLTFLSPDIEPGVNMDTLSPEDCKVLLHAKGGMVENERVLGLKERYENRYGEAYELLKRRQQFPIEKIEELVDEGFFTSVESAYRTLYGASYDEAKFKQIHQKLKKDLIGY